MYRTVRDPLCQAGFVVLGVDSRAGIGQRDREAPYREASGTRPWIATGQVGDQAHPLVGNTSPLGRIVPLTGATGADICSPSLGGGLERGGQLDNVY